MEQHEMNHKPQSLGKPKHSKSQGFDGKNATKKGRGEGSAHERNLRKEKLLIHHNIRLHKMIYSLPPFILPSNWNLGLRGDQTSLNLASHEHLSTWLKIILLRAKTKCERCLIWLPTSSLYSLAPKDGRKTILPLIYYMTKTPVGAKPERYIEVLIQRRPSLPSVA